MPCTLADTYDTCLSFATDYLIVSQLSFVDQFSGFCRWMFSIINVEHKLAEVEMNQMELLLGVCQPLEPIRDMQILARVCARGASILPRIPHDSLPTSEHTVVGELRRPLDVHPTWGGASRQLIPREHADGLQVLDAVSQGNDTVVGAPYLVLWQGSMHSVKA